LRHQFKHAWISLLLVVAATVTGFVVARFGTTGIVMLYLLAVMAASYFLGFFAAILAAIGSFLAINYFFIEPRYTFEVANAESWAALLGFLAVSVVVASLVMRLQDQTFQAQRAKQRAEFARLISEQLADLHDEDSVFIAGCRLIHQTTGLPAGIAIPDMSGGQFTLAHQCPEGSVGIDHRAAKWCCQNAKVIGPGSDNWPEIGKWIIPFERLPGVFPVLVVMKGDTSTDDDEIGYLRDMLDQILTAYQRVRNERRAKDAERHAQEEAIQNALLASVSHDMRTPLTAILGATTTLLGQRAVLGDSEQVRLLESVRAEAQHLANTTENILSLSRLESNIGRDIELDWQSLEEIVGAVLQRYRNRNLPYELRSDVPQDVPLIKADAALLSQALGNLVDNAMAAHGGTEPVWVGVEKCGEQIALCVKDRGKGFPEGFRIEHIRKFHRMGMHGKGMGLGLSIVHAIAKLHGADLRIIHREGGGTAVELIFAENQTGGGFE